MGEPGASPDGRTDTLPASGLAWLGRLSAYLASFAGGVAVNDLSTTLGYHGLAGAIALLAVVTAATWIRGLDPRARLPRGATWLFLVPAACMAVAAAFISGTAAGLLTVAAAFLTVGAVLIVRELQSAERLLAGVALIISAAAVIAGCTTSIAADNAGLGTALIPCAATFFIAGMAYIAGRDTTAAAAVIAAGGLLIAAGVAIFVTNTPVNPIGDTSGLILIFVAGGILVLEGPTLIMIGLGYIHSWEEPWPTSLYAASRFRLGVSPAIAATCAIMIATVANASLTITKVHTRAGIEHVSEARTLTLLAFIAIFAVYAASLVLAVGPRVLMGRFRHAIDWATKAPPGT